MNRYMYPILASIKFIFCILSKSGIILFFNINVIVCLVRGLMSVKGGILDTMILKEFGIGDIADIASGGNIGGLIDDMFTSKEKIFKSKNKVDGYRYSSIAKAASNLIATFPVLCSTNVSKDTASLITKMIERKACVFLQLFLSAINKTSKGNAVEFLRQVHQNLDTSSMNLDDFIDYMDTYGESSQIRLSREEAAELVDVMKRQNATFYDSSFNVLPLNTFKITESMDNFTVSIDKSKTAMYEVMYKPGKEAGILVGNMKDQDVKKINEAVPSLLIVNYSYLANNGNDHIDSSFIIGVKAKLIPTNYREIINKIKKSNKPAGGFGTLMKLTTGELKFFKDFLFAIDQNRDAILQSRQKGSREQIWKTLENRAAQSKWQLRKYGSSDNTATAITTVVITAEDADQFFKETNTHITNPKEAQKFIEAYNLLGLVIVDDVEESALVMFDDGDAYFEKLAYTMLERESTDKEYKKIINLMARSRY